MLPPDAYSAYARESPPAPNVPALAIPFEQAIARTIWGVVMIGIGLGLAFVWSAGSLFFNVGGMTGSGVLFAALGFGCMLAALSAMGVAHRRWVLAGLALAVLACALFLLLPAVLGVPDANNGYVAEASADRTCLLVSVLVVPVAFASVALASFGLQDRTGRFLVVLGVASAVVAQVLLWSWLSPALDVALTESLATRSPYSLAAFPVLWSRLGGVNAVPAGLLLVAYERLYWQLHRRYFPGRSSAHA